MPEGKNGILTREELDALLRERVGRLYGISLEEYLARRERDELPDVPGGSVIDVLAGERRSSKSA